MTMPRDLDGEGENGVLAEIQEYIDDACNDASYHYEENQEVDKASWHAGREKGLVDAYTIVVEAVRELLKKNELTFQMYKEDQISFEDLQVKVLRTNPRKVFGEEHT